MDPTKLLTVKQAAEAIPAMTESGLRYLIFHREENGLKASGAVQRIGRRVYVDLERFGKWVEDQEAA